MKHLLLLLAILVSSAFYSTAALSEEKTMGLPNDYGQFKTYELNGQKDECLIVAKNCVGGSETVTERIDRLNREIGKGTKVYTPEELRSLQDQLKWINSESKTTL